MFEPSEYIKRQDQGWDLIGKYEEDENPQHLVSALKILGGLDIYVEEGGNILLYQQAKTLLGIAYCLANLNDMLDAKVYFDKLENLTPSVFTPQKQELYRLQQIGREIKIELQK